MTVLPLALKGPCLGATPACWAGRPHRLAVFELVYDLKQFLLFIFFKLAFINRDVVVITDTSCIYRFCHVKVSGPTGRAKRYFDAKINTLESEDTVRQASECRPSVPVNLTCKLTRKQQTVKFKSVSARFPNHSYAGYRQGSADTEGDKRSYKMSV